MTPMVRFDKVAKRYGAHTVLDGLDLDIARGEKVSIIGPSGSGKTTVLRMLMTLETINDGVIWVEGEPLTHMERNGKLVPADPAHIRRIRAKAGRPAARAGERADVIVYWPSAATEVTARLKTLRGRLVPAGGIWVITAKRDRQRAGRPYLGNDVIALGLASGLVDNKICAISESDTAMRFVIRRSDR